MPVKSQPHPIFERYTINSLARRLGVTEAYIVAMKDGYKPVGRLFRRRAALILRKDESELFLPSATGTDGRREDA